MRRYRYELFRLKKQSEDRLLIPLPHWKAASAYNEYCERGVAFSPSSALLQSMRNIYPADV